MHPTPEVQRVTVTMTADAVALANALAAINPAWGTRVVPFGDWWAVLCGAGFYVNRLEGGGLERPLTTEQLVEFEERAAEVGVGPSVAVVGGDAAHPGTSAVLAERGYQSESTVTVGIVRLESLGDVGSLADEFVLEPVADDTGLEAWQAAAAAGWGHHTAEARHTSDEFARAAHHAPGSTLMLVRDAADARVVATCSLAIRDRLATLGGMSVLPSERRRGVQAAAIGLRLGVARRAGCDLAATSTVVGGDSERNVRRHGFEYSHAVTTWSKWARSNARFETLV